MALFTVLEQGGRERKKERFKTSVIEVIVEEECGKQWALTDIAVSLITTKCDTMSKAIIKAQKEIHSKRLHLHFLLLKGYSACYYKV